MDTAADAPPPAPQLRPLALGEILDASIKLYRAHAKALLTIVLVVVLPVQVLSTLITTSTTETYDVTSAFTLDLDETGVTYSDEDAYYAGQAVVIFLSVIVGVLATIACFKAIADAYLGDQPTTGGSLGFALRRAGATIWLGLLLIICLTPAFLAFVIPGIWLVVAWSVAFPVMLFERIGGFKAMARSYRLVKGRWWSTFGTLFIGYLLASVVAAVIQGALLAVLLLSVDGESTLALILEGAATVLATLVTTPFQAAILVLLYFDLRVRKEGFDLQLIAERMGQPAPTAPPQFLPPVAAPPVESWSPPPPPSA